jgi:hypothetical protein
MEGGDDCVCRPRFHITPAATGTSVAAERRIQRGVEAHTTTPGAYVQETPGRRTTLCSAVYEVARSSVARRLSVEIRGAAVRA